MKKLKVKLKDISFILIYVLGLYLYEFYFFLDESRTLRCIEILSETILLFEFKVPIHCDSQYYFKASNSFEYFFSSENPYQKRPIFVFILYFFQNTIKFLSFNILDTKQIFLLSTISVQISILYLISKQVSIYLDLSKKNNTKYLYFLMFFLIPNIRWNMFFPSHGSLTLLGILFTLNYVNNKKTLRDVGIFKVVLIFGVLSLTHRLFLVYGLVFLIFQIFNNKNFKPSIFYHVTILAVPTILYNFSIEKLGLTSFDYNAVAYKQFYWLIDKLNSLETFNDGEFCQELNTFYKCNFSVTYDLIKFYWYQILLLILFSLIQKKFYKNYKIINLIIATSFIFVFWSFIGWYPPFRFINYSLGYFIFLAFALLVRSNFIYESIYIASMLISLLDVKYLDVYNNPEYFLYTEFKIISTILILIGLEFEFKFFSKKIKFLTN